MKNKCVCSLCLLRQILLLKLNIWQARYLLAELLEERLQHKGDQQGGGGGRREASTNVPGSPAHASSAADCA